MGSLETVLFRTGMLLPKHVHVVDLQGCTPNATNTETVYAVLKQRNSKVFKGNCVPTMQVVKEIVFTVACNCIEKDMMYLLC